MSGVSGGGNGIYARPCLYESLRSVPVSLPGYIARAPLRVRIPRARTALYDYAIMSFFRSPMTAFHRKKEENSIVACAPTRAARNTPIPDDQIELSNILVTFCLRAL